jgi:hypothetical protein
MQVGKRFAIKSVTYVLRPDSVEQLTPKKKASMAGTLPFA